MWQVYGQEQLLAQLESSLKQDRPSHAYLLVGPPHVGKMALAINLAQSVNCLDGPGAPCGACLQCTRIKSGHHADVRVVSIDRGDRGDSQGPARTVVGIADVKEVLHQVNLKPFEGSYSVVIFETAELMSIDAANALLKTLEEPPPQVMLLLLTTSEEALLTTIRSRCRRLLLKPLAKDRIADRLLNEYRADPVEAEKLARLSRGCLGWAITALEGGAGFLEAREEELDRLIEVCESGLDTRFGLANDLARLFYGDRDSVKQSLYFWLRWWRDLLLLKEGAEDYVQNTDRVTQLRTQAGRLTTVQIVGFIKGIIDTLEALDRNASARLALEVLMLELPAAVVRS